jgi:replicative DNA helicase
VSSTSPTPSTGRRVEAVSLSDALRSTDAAVAAGRPTTRAWPTGLHPLDHHLGGGLHAGDLALVAGSQGVGKTTTTLQVARNVVAAGGHATYVCYEHAVSTLAERVLALEAALAAGDHAPTLEEIRVALSRPQPGTGLRGRVADLPGMAEALAAVDDWGDRLCLLAARSDVTGLGDIRELARSRPAGLLVVDYLQKVPVTAARDDDTRVAAVASALKDLALDLEVPVLAIAAVERPRGAAGVEWSGRLRTHHLRGSSTVAYEADVVLLLQDKYDVVAREHLVYDTSAANRHHRWLVCSLAKNRHGEDGVDLEFRKRLAHGLLDPLGHVVEDRLVDERLDGQAG